ncbi:hypothetical protein HanPSC8_Chr01g0006871 [Helianthus annuus]|nr:hypothetical protein HanPSC8_Chr01g0006871 [Helianthus annuus]
MNKKTRSHEHRLISTLLEKEIISNLVEIIGISPKCDFINFKISTANSYTNIYIYNRSSFFCPIPSLLLTFK